MNIYWNMKLHNFVKISMVNINSTITCRLQAFQLELEPIYLPKKDENIQ